MYVRVLCWNIQWNNISSYCWIAANCMQSFVKRNNEGEFNTTIQLAGVTLIESEFLEVWRQNVTRVTSYWPLSQFTLGCSIRVLYFWWFRRTDVTPPKPSFTLEHFVPSCNTLLFQILCFMHCIAELVLKMFCSLIIALNSLDVCWTISHNAVPFDVTLYHFTPSCVRDLRLHRLNVCQAISRKAVPFDVVLYNLTEYCAISSGADSFDPTLNCFTRLCAISCSAIPSFPVSIVIMLCHFM